MAIDKPKLSSLCGDNLNEKTPRNATADWEVLPWERDLACMDFSILFEMLQCAPSFYRLWNEAYTFLNSFKNPFWYKALLERTLQLINEELFGHGQIFFFFHCSGGQMEKDWSEWRENLQLIKAAVITAEVLEFKRGQHINSKIVLS